MGRRIVELSLFIGADALVLLTAHVGEPTDGRMHDPRQVPLDEPRVPAGDGDFGRKRQVVTNKYGIS